MSPPTPPAEDDESTALLSNNSTPNNSSTFTTTTSNNNNISASGPSMPHHQYGSTNDSSNDNGSNNNIYGNNGASSENSLPSEIQPQSDHSSSGETDTDIQQQQQPSPPTEDDDSSADGNDEEESRVSALTRRLRCLFSTITWPIVPLGTIVALALLWVLYAASSLDLRRSCSHPLHWYALASLTLVAYIPFHAQVRSHLFSYQRERDGPIRPARVRMFDQFFHTVCLLYVYTGVTLIQTCREDIVTGQDAAADKIAGNEIAMPNDGPLNSCQATCPNLYQALSVYVATLEMFTFALILPLLFLPCIYLWFLRRATAEAEAFAQLQDRLQEEEALLSNGGVTASEIIDSLENVKLVSRTETSNNPVKEEADQEIWLLPYSATDASIGMKSDVKECCICMSDFPIHKEADLEDGLFENKRNNPRGNDRGACNHSSRRSTDDSNHSDHDGSTVDLKECIIVRTRCGHVFHKECLSGWVGGRWQLHANGVDSSSNSNSNMNIDDESTPERRRRRARQTCCPLCREDLRP